LYYFQEILTLINTVKMSFCAAMK